MGAKLKPMTSLLDGCTSTNPANPLDSHRVCRTWDCRWTCMMQLQVCKQRFQTDVAFAPYLSVDSLAPWGFTGDSNFGRGKPIESITNIRSQLDGTPLRTYRLAEFDGICSGLSGLMDRPRGLQHSQSQSAVIICERSYQSRPGASYVALDKQAY